MTSWMAFPLALMVVVILAPAVISWLRSKKSVQPISPDAPEKHRLKHGTPTMGGLLLLAGVTVASLAVALPGASERERPAVLAQLGIFLAGGAIGFLDDLGKARKKENKAGLSERGKLALQALTGGLFVASLPFVGIEGVWSQLHLFGLTLDLGYGYCLFALVFLIGFANAVNFTDGLDGLAAGTTLIVAMALGALSGNFNYVQQDALYFALGGACAGFLLFNRSPARVFMGDTGSLALGMGLAGIALLAKQEVLLLLVGVVYLVEIASMMLQRYVFKYRRIRYGIEFARAHRVFRRAPLHHHFEELGWHETRVVYLFWALGLLAAALGAALSGGLILKLAHGGVA